MTEQIELRLQNDIVSVSGTVNGVAVVFTLSDATNGTLWVATVDRADNDMYQVTVYAVNGQGTTTTLTTTLYYGMAKLITDRIGYDVNMWRALRDKGYANMTAEEKSLWDSGTMKGAYNISDLNRVGGALNYVRDRLAAASYVAADEFTAKGDWTNDDIPTAVQLRYYLNCVAVIREAMSHFATTPPTPAYSGGLTHIEANNIEQILIDVDILITNMLNARYFCGELYAGEVI